MAKQDQFELAQPLNLTKIQRLGAILATVLLLLLALAYSGKGLKVLALDKLDAPFKGAACDMQMRWVELQYLFRGKHPFAVYWQLHPAAQSELAPKAQGGTSHHGDVSVEPDLGAPTSPGYPPWSYFTAIFLMWPSNWQMAKLWYAGVNVLAIAVIGIFGYHIGKIGGKEMGCLFAAASLAMGSICGSLGVGQFSIIVTAALIATWWLVENDYPILAGIAFGVSLFKPTISATFIIPLLVKRRWMTLATAAVYIAVGSCFMWWRSGEDPLAVLRSMREGPMHEWSFQGSHDLLSLMGLLGWNERLALNGIAATVMILAIGLIFHWRNAPLLYLFTIAAIAGRLWTYHRFYDDVILVFLLAAVGEAAIRQRNVIGAATFFLTGVTLWLPQRISDDAVGLGIKIWLPMILVWLVSTGVLLAIAPQYKKASP